MSPINLCVMNTLKYKTQLLMQTAEGALTPCIVNAKVGKLQAFKLQIRITKACSIELFDKGTNVRQLSSLFNNLKLGYFWLVEGVFSDLFCTVKETWIPHIT